jgi:hypothetical protein
VLNTYTYNNNKETGDVTDGSAWGITVNQLF